MAKRKNIPAPLPETASATVTSEEGAGSSGLMSAAPSDGVMLALPLPAGVAAGDLRHAVVIVKASAAAGRRRAGYGFTRDATEIPWTDLDPEAIASLGSDSALTVAVRIPKPAD
jgi:hypothetical protein